MRPSFENRSFQVSTGVCALLVGVAAANSTNGELAFHRAVKEVIDTLGPVLQRDDRMRRLFGFPKAS